MLSSRHVACALLIFLSAATTQSQTILERSWANLGTDFATGANWVGGEAPTSAEIARFDTTTPTAQPNLATPGASVSGVLFGNAAGPFTLSGSGMLSVGAAGIENQSPMNTQTIATALEFNAATSSINNQGTLVISGLLANNTSGGLVLTGSGNNGTISGAISGSGALIKTGGGTWRLDGTNTYEGNTTVSAGTLYVGSSSVVSGGTIASGPVGRGTLILQSGATLAPAGPPTSFAPYDDITIANPVTVHTGVTLGSAIFDGDQWLTLSGLVTAASASTTIHLGGNEPVFLSGGLTAASSNTSVTFDSGGQVDAAGLARRGVAVLGGLTSTNVANLTVNNAGLIFSSPSSIPDAGHWVQAVNGYVGVGALNAAAVPSPSDLLARIVDKPGFSGTFGFDTDEDAFGTPYDFTQNLDFTGFGANLTIGSVSSAILSGTITPPAATGYQFGNGGGALIVRSNLADAGGPTSVSVNSSAAIGKNALTVIFQGNNTFTGNLSVSNSLAILDSANALPAGATFSLGANGYVGYTQAAAPSFSSFVSRLASYTPTSVLGFDSRAEIAYETGEPYASFDFNAIIPETLDLSLLAPVYIGTATHATLTGQILAPNAGGADRTLSLLGANGGHLVVRSPLGGTNVKRVVIGTSQAPLALGVVEVSGNNTYSGGTTLLSGVLLVGGGTRVSTTGSLLSGPLGTGTLTVGSAALHPTLAPSYSLLDTILHNAIQLGSALQIGLDHFLHGGTAAATANYMYGYSNFILTGVISDLAGTSGGPKSLDIHTSTALHGANTFTGGVNLRSGTLTIGHDAALGSGTLTIEPPAWYGDIPRLNVASGARTIANPVALNLFDYNWLEITGSGSLTFAGPVSLNSSVTFAPSAHPVYFSGGIGGPGRLLTGGGSPLVITGTNTYEGGTHAYHGTIVFGSAASVPTTGLLSAFYSAYIGVASSSFASSLQASFLDRFDKPDMYGTIGFDTLSGATNVFADDIDLAGFGYGARLGSSTGAILSGTITPQSGGSYQFGGGGGLLEVNSNLVNDPAMVPRPVVVSSPPDAPLTLRLGGANSYTGATTVSHSAVIFKEGSLPPAAALAQFFVSNGYIGTEEAGAAFSLVDYIARFDPSMSRGIIGFDSFAGTPYHVTGELSLSPFDSSAIVYLGTATWANISGAITLPAGQGTYRFAGYKGGQLTVSSTLANAAGGTRSVIIGDFEVEATFGNPANLAAPRSGVTLSAANTYSGGTTLSAGVLHLGSSSVMSGSSILSGPIGTGPLVVDANTLGHLRLGLFAASGTTQTLANAITLHGDLDVGGGLALSGAISGAGGLYKVDPETLTLSGTNTFGGGMFIGDGNVTFTTAAAVGTGGLWLRGLGGASATFLENSIVNGIAGGNSAHRIIIGGGKALTINQTENTHYAGTFESTGGSIGLVFKAPAGSTPKQLRLMGDSSFSGTTTIQGGIAVIAGSNAVFGAATNLVTLDGGRLVVDPGVVVANPLALNSGVLAGFGTFHASSTLQIGTGITLSPGGPQTPGTLSFTEDLAAGTVLRLENGGVYRWQIADATNENGGWDHISVAGGVAFVAATTPFVFKIVPAGPLDLLGSVANFDPFAAQSWAVLSATAIHVTGSLASAVTIDSSAVTSLIAGGGFNFSLANNTAGIPSLMLNFTPVPEPSTYALLGIGVVAVFLVSRRRKR